VNFNKLAKLSSYCQIWTKITGTLGTWNSRRVSDLLSRVTPKYLLENFSGQKCSQMWNTYLIFCSFFFSWVFETTKRRQYIHKIFTVCLYRNIILSDNSRPLITETVSRDDRQRSTLRYFSLPWIGVHSFKFNVLQLMLPCY